jgi:hypothetical protein
MKAAIILSVVAVLSASSAAEAQRRNNNQSPDSKRPVIIYEQRQLPRPPERRIDPPRGYYDISPPRQGPTPLAPMAPRAGGG